MEGASQEKLLRKNLWCIAAQGFALVASVSSMASYSLANVTVTNLPAEQGQWTQLHEVSIDDVQMKTQSIGGQHYVAPQLIGVEGHEGVLFRPGMPQIPVVRMVIDGDATVTVQHDALAAVETKSVGALQVLPVQLSGAKVAGVQAPFIMNRQAYATNASYPERAFEVTKVGTVRGVARQLVTLYPMAYNPVTREYSLRRNFSILVKGTVKSQQILEEAGKGLAIVVGQKFASSQALAQYMAFKTQQGFTVTTMTVPAVDASTPNKVRDFLKGVFKDTSKGILQSVLIIGDHGDVPGADASNIMGVTDLFYACLDNDDYDADIGTPDVTVGRISAYDEAQLTGILAKYSKYQMGQFADNAWLNRIAFVATDDSGNYDVAEGTHNWAIDTYTAARGFLGKFPIDNNPGGDKLYAITHNASGDHVSAAMLDGRAIINYSGHGSTTSWAGPDVQQSDVRAMSHADSLPFVISNACVTGQYTVGESFAETWQRHPKGAIMFWGSMDSTYWDEDDVLEKKMYDGIFALNKKSFGDIAQHALLETWKHYGGEGRSKYYMETYVTFGDPTAELRLGNAQ